MMYKETEVLGADWLLAFEDDAEVLDPDALENLIVNVRAWKSVEPTVISLYTTSKVAAVAPSSEDQLASPQLSRQIVAPSHAVAYFINAEARAIALAAPHHPVTSADWPTWSVRVHFYLFSGVPLISHPHEGSLMSGRGANRSSRRIGRLLRILRLGARGDLWTYFETVSGFILWIVTPLLRKENSTFVRFILTTIARRVSP